MNRMTKQEAMERVVEMYPEDPIAAEILAFVRSVKRGLAPWAGVDNMKEGAEE